jgi:hypothetical protein
MIETTMTVSDTCTHCNEPVSTDITQMSVEKAGSYDLARKLALLQKCSCPGARKELREIGIRNFKGFVGGDLVNLMEEKDLVEISVKTPNGNTAKLKKNANGIIEQVLTTKESL